MSNKQEMHQRQHTDKSYLFRRCVTLCTRADLSANLPICAAVLHALGIKSIDPITSQPISPNEIRAQLAIAMANMLLDTNSGVTPGELAQRSPLRPVTAYCEIDSDDARNSHEKVGDSLASQPEKAKGIKQVGSNTLLEDTIAILVEHHLLTPAMLSKLTKDAKQANKADIF